MNKKRSIIFSIAIMFFLLSSCIGANPKINEFFGLWINQDSVSLRLNSNGTFEAYNFPTKLFFYEPEDLKI